MRIGANRARWRLGAPLAVLLANLGCHSTPEPVPRWMWPPPIGVSLLRGSVATDASNRADPRIVYLVPVEKTAPLPSLGRAAVVRWRAGAFEPLSIAVRLGGTLRIVNEGAQAHRLFTAGERRMQIDLPGRASLELQAEERGPSHVYCSLHPTEYFLVYTSPQRYLASVASDGSWRLGPVMPGDYRLMLWTPSGEGVVREVRVWPWTVQRHRRLQLGAPARGR